MNQSKHGNAGSNGFWKHVISKIWLGSTASRWSSSGIIFQESLHWELSTRFKRRWLNQSVNQSNSKEGSSSCHCTMTLIGQNEEMKNIVLPTLSELLSTLEDSRKDIALFWSPDSENKWHGTHVNRLDGVRDKTAEGMMLNFAQSGHPVLLAGSALERGELKSKKEEEWKPFTSTVLKKPLNWFFAQLFPSISSMSTEQHQICVTNLPETHEVQGNLFSGWWRSTRKLVAWIRAETRRTSWTREVGQTLLQCRSREEYWQRTVLHHTWWGTTWRHEKHHVESTFYLET